LNKFCSFSFTVLLCSQLLGCASQNSKDVADDVLSGIDSLALKASKCINSKSQKGLDCIEFADAYKNGGFDNIKAFKDNLPEIYKKDLDAGLNATEKLNIIISAVVFLSRT
jgi:hypothetical protein